TGLGKASPYLLVIVAFTVLYKLVPNTHVRMKPAMIGGLAGGAAWAATGTVFATFVVSASRYDLIYSSFAIVILTMLWLNLSWLMLLLGSQLAFYVQNPEFLRRGTRIVELSPALGERLALSVMLFVGRAFDEREPGLDTEALASRLKLPRHFLEPIVAALAERRLLVETLENRLMPGDDLHAIRLEEILDAVRGLGGTGSDRAAGPAVEALAERIDVAAQDAVKGRTLADLISEAEAAEAAGPATASSRGSIARRR
ncbi:MAG TPA: YhjD/YihY/BrkB family envelope integrity protein, partial [Gammaproteobacteria bacterium]|nr:YhjD/YihY/BrkB family envelope integrity protein [Gammaproteobacteria bacterium]